MYFDTGLQRDCRGCTACATVCPVGAIEMRTEEGFAYPFIDKDKCINCKLCEKTCKATTEEVDKSCEPSVYYGWNKDLQVRWNSTSGGAFSAIIDAFLSLHPDGWVYGVIYDEFHRAKHVGTQDRKVMRSMCRSKYVQSDMTGIYTEIIERLKQHQYVVFSGTPCQVAGLKSISKKYEEYLLTVDFICHGVSNPEYFKEYISALEKRKSSKVKSYSVRNKHHSIWRKSYRLVRVNYENGSTDLTDSDLYIISYKMRLFYRESCYKCSFASVNRCADITMGDFWGLEYKKKELKKERLRGLSMVQFNSEKAVALKKTVDRFFEFHSLNEDFEKYKHLFKPTSKPSQGYPEYDSNTDFIEYLKKIITPIRRWKYMHPKIVNAGRGVLGALKKR